MSEIKDDDDGELIRPRLAAEGGYYQQCCGCDLWHRLDFYLDTANGPADPREVELTLRVYRCEEGGPPGMRPPVKA